jgi:mono/diheme cytochrome c family protein
MHVAYNGSRMRASLIVFSLAAALYAQQSASVWDGVYTQAQADRGKAQYGMNCASCHGADLGGTGQAPPLQGADFLGNWKGQTADDLFEKIQTSMPADQPGKLSRVQNADILAFLFASNGFPAGRKELSSDAAALQNIHITSK